MALRGYALGSRSSWGASEVSACREPRSANEKCAQGVSAGRRLKACEEQSDEAALRTRRMLARTRRINFGHPLVWS